MFVAYLEPIDLFTSQPLSKKNNFISTKKINLQKNTIVGRNDLIIQNKKCSRNQCIFQFDPNTGKITVNSVFSL